VAATTPYIPFRCTLQHHWCLLAGVVMAPSSYYHLVLKKKVKKKPMILSAGRQAARGHIIWKFCLCATTFMPFHFLINILLLNVWIILAACPI
jgi:hypothetical protein